MTVGIKVSEEKIKSMSAAEKYKLAQLYLKLKMQAAMRLLENERKAKNKLRKRRRQNELARISRKRNRT